MLHRQDLTRYDLTRFPPTIPPPIAFSFTSTFIQRKDMTNSDHHSATTQGSAVVLTLQVWKTLASGNSNADARSQRLSHLQILVLSWWFAGASFWEFRKHLVQLKTLRYKQCVEKYYTSQDGAFLQHHLPLISPLQNIPPAKSTAGLVKITMKNLIRILEGFLRVQFYLRQPSCMLPERLVSQCSSHCWSVTSSPTISLWD